MIVIQSFGKLSSSLLLFLLELSKVLFPALTSLFCILQEFVRQELLHAPSLLRVFDEAICDKVFKGWAPFLRDWLNRLINYSVEQIL